MKKLLLLLTLVSSFVFAEEYENSGNFDGFYVGISAGSYGHIARRSDYDGFFDGDNGNWTNMDIGFGGGIHGGYDWQTCNKILGVVVDFCGGSAESKFTHEPNGAGTNKVTSSASWFSTLRVRSGITTGNALFYITSGIAIANVEAHWRDGADSLKYDETRFGWTGGVGGEYQLKDCWYMGSELLFLQFKDDDKSYAVTGPATVRLGHNDTVWMGKVTLNYRFN